MLLRRNSLIALLCMLPLGAQPDSAPLMTGPESLRLTERILHLMESLSFTVPDLGRAAAPLLAGGKQARLNLQVSPGQMHSGHTYAFLKSARGFASLFDALPRPYPYQAEARKQQLEFLESLQRLETHLTALLDQREISLRPPDRDNLRRYSKANLELPPPANGKPRVIFYGDSITDFWRIQEYFPGQDYLNRGISGQVTSEMLGRLKADVLDLKPAAALILAGTNDIGRGTALQTIQNNLTMIADLLTAHKIKPIFASILPVSDYHKDQNPAYEMTKRRPPDQIRSMNQWLKSFCQNRGFTYVNYFDALADGGGMLKKEAADDGLHPNATGYRLMAPVAAQAIQQALGIAPPSTRKR
jgi:lysophospholipase L1-like esterase